MAAQQSAAVARLTPPHHWPQPQLDLNPVVDKVPNTSFSHSEQNWPLKLGHDFSSQVSKVNIYMMTSHKNLLETLPSLLLDPAIDVCAWRL